MFKNYLFLLAFCLIIFSSCQNEVCNCPVDEVVQRSNDSIYTLVKNHWNRDNHWRKYDEPYLDTVKYEVYRVYLYSLFGEMTHIHRIEQNSNGYQVSIKKYHNTSAFRGVEDSLPFKNVIRPLSKRKWDSITNKIKEYCFWTMKTRMSKGSCLDENPLLLEGNNPKMKCANIKPYHLVGGSCIDSLSGYKYFELCDLLLDLDKE